MFGNTKGDKMAKRKTDDVKAPGDDAIHNDAPPAEAQHAAIEKLTPEQEAVTDPKQLGPLGDKTDAARRMAAESTAKLLKEEPMPLGSRVRAVNAAADAFFFEGKLIALASSHNEFIIEVNRLSTGLTFPFIGQFSPDKGCDCLPRVVRDGDACACVAARAYFAL